MIHATSKLLKEGEFALLLETNRNMDMTCTRLNVRTLGSLHTYVAGVQQCLHVNVSVSCLPVGKNIEGG